jgi:hypothetical protein
MAIIGRHLTLTQANIANAHIYLTECMDIFPPDALGGASKSDAAARKVEIECGSQVVQTDVVREKRIFRHRGWVRRFFSESRIAAGHRVLLEQLEPYRYRISKEPCTSVKCLSIQQPWVDLIFDRKKLVENRSRPWKEAMQNLGAGRGKNSFFGHPRKLPSDPLGQP